jgi:anti-anti-sigma factor
LSIMKGRTRSGLQRHTRPLTDQAWVCAAWTPAGSTTRPTPGPATSRRRRITAAGHPDVGENFSHQGNTCASWASGRAVTWESAMTNVGSHGYEFTITVTKSENLHVTIRLAGALNENSVSMLTACLEQQLGLGRRYGQLDLSGLDSIDSGGLESILGAHHLFLARHGTLIVRGASPAVRSVIRDLHLDQVLLIAAPVATSEPTSCLSVSAVRIPTEDG